MDSLTPSQQRLITSALILAAGENLSGLKVDYEALAKSAGLKSAASAQVMFCKARRNFLDAVKSKKNGGDANTDETVHKKTSADKVSKRSPKTPGKGKAAAKASTKAAVEAAPIAPDEGTPEVRSEKNRAQAGKKVKNEPVDTNIAIKPEPENKADPEFGYFADGILQGTQYPQTKKSWVEADAVFNEAQAYMSMTEDSSSGSGLSTPVTD